MIYAACDKCGDEIGEEGGAVTVAPPDPPGSRNVEKGHLCRACWVRFLRWVNQE